MKEYCLLENCKGGLHLCSKVCPQNNTFALCLGGGGRIFLRFPFRTMEKIDPFYMKKAVLQISKPKPQNIPQVKMSVLNYIQKPIETYCRTLTQVLCNTGSFCSLLGRLYQLQLLSSFQVQPCTERTTIVNARNYERHRLLMIPHSKLVITLLSGFMLM